MLTSLRSRIGLSIGATIFVAAMVTIGFVALELKELEQGGNLDPAHVEYAELLLVLLPFAVIAPLVGVLVAGWSLKPLSAAVAALQEIGPDQPNMRLCEEGLPYEIKPFVAATTQALDRLAGAYLNERRLAADAAHALRTPLALAKLRMDQWQDGASIDVAGLASDLDRMQRSIAQVLAMARLDAPVPPDDDKPLVDASRLARQVAAEFLPLADKLGRTIIVNAEIPAPVHVPDLDEALRNLVSNALHHGQGTVSLSVFAAGEEVVMTVQDEGTGVPEAERIRMLSRFAKGEHSPGSGLGLAIAASAMERAGGRLTWSMPSTLQLQMPRCLLAAKGDG
ncbi:HAMP domain-containing sensor histidine kinase [Novosphingobium sp.]|uniref:sensor histidine kinase n=1 Tax=Novosphingobium sp. TaxID=1874826 RepID=UPI0026270E4B|nr:HAMP domain-containing sensor histidine kinase [Novosphingobium sp.]